MATRPRYTKSLSVQMKPETHSLLERMNATDPAAHSLAAAARILMELGTEAYLEAHPEAAE